MWGANPHRHIKDVVLFMGLPIYDDWIWSFSRLSLYEQCPYAFALKYLYGEDSAQTNFYAEFGLLIHKIHELYYTGELNDKGLVPYYIEHFNDVSDHKYKTKYFVEGLNYLNGGIAVKPRDIVGVEKLINFKVDNYNFVGFIDLLYRNKDGTLTICDHKSHPLSPRSNRKKPTASDKELDNYLRQLYLYAHGVHQLGLGNVGGLQFNCFRGSKIVSERYSEDKEKEAVEWAADTIHKIENAGEFMPDYDWFYCNNLCDNRRSCEYK